MKRTTIKLNIVERNLLKEWIRRTQYFHKGQLDAQLLMLAYRGEIKSLIEKGILKLSGYYPPCVLTWSQLTERGKRIMRQFKRKGLFSKAGDYTGKSCGTIPNKVTIYEENY